MKRRDFTRFVAQGGVGQMRYLLVRIDCPGHPADPEGTRYGCATEEQFAFHVRLLARSKQVDS